MKRRKIAESDPMYAFGDKLKALRDEKGWSNTELRKAIESKLGYSFSDATLNNWLQHFAVPDYDKLRAICEVFPPYSADYFIGRINEMPNLNYSLIGGYTGLSKEAIENIQSINLRLKNSYPSVLNDFLESDSLDCIVENITDSLAMEFEIPKVVHTVVRQMIDFIYLLKRADKDQVSKEDLIIAQSGLEQSINSISDRGMQNSLPALRIETFKRNIRSQIEKYMDDERIIPKCKSESYYELLAIYNEYLNINPFMDKIDEDYCEKRLLPAINRLMEHYNLEDFQTEYSMLVGEGYSGKEAAKLINKIVKRRFGFYFDSSGMLHQQKGEKSSSVL